jgi:hypothetical protein
MRWLGLLALLCVLPALAQAPAEVEPSGLQARVVPERVLLGEPFVYELVITHPAEHRYEVELPSELGDFSLLSQTRQRQDAPQGAGPSVTTFGLRLSAFALGKLTLPEVPFTVATPEGPRRFVAPGRTVEVASTLPEDAEEKGAELKDIQPPTEVTIPSWAMVWWLLLLSRVVALAAGLALVVQGRRKQVREVVAPPAPLDVRTRRALDMLKAEGLPEQGRVKEFYFRLSEVLRGYLGERYGFDALECTSTELMMQLRRLPTPGLPEDELMRFVSESDMVKYARAEVSTETCSAALAFGYELLVKTWPPPPPPEAALESHASGSRRVS